MNSILNMVVIYYVVTFIAAIALITWAIRSRLKEKEIEKEKHKDYNKY